MCAFSHFRCTMRSKRLGTAGIPAKKNPQNLLSNFRRRRLYIRRRQIWRQEQLAIAASEVGGAEFAGGEVFDGLEARVYFGSGEAAFAVETTQKVPRGTVALADVTFHTA